MKSCVEGGAAKKKESIPQEEKEKKLLRGKIKCPNCGQLGHRKASPKCPLNGSKKGKPNSSVFYFVALNALQTVQ
jgi:hypothetical protein